jgi:putative N6-adenine-specific DNA methylase
MNQYFATTARGLETVAASELETLGAADILPDFTGVHFSGDKALMYRVNLWARTIFRVLMPIAEFRCLDRKMLFQEVERISWEDYLKPQNTLAVKCTGSNEQLNHTHFTALQVKDAIASRQKKKFGRRSNVDTNNPDLLVNVHIKEDRCIISLDSSANSLHRRGYRLAVGSAPLKETLAAALLDMAEYSPDLPFLDPLCGSGTLPIEAALKALNIAPGLLREKFGFTTWQDFDDALWNQLLEEAENSQLSELKAPIYASDRNSNVLDQARSNAKLCGVDKEINFAKTELSQLEAPAEKGILMCNPPYGERLGEAEELGEFYQLLGDIFKQRFKGWTAYILTGNRQLMKKVGLRTSRRLHVYNGSIECTLLKYELY